MVTEVGKDFEVIDHTADVGVVAYGADLKQAFANAALELLQNPKEWKQAQKTAIARVEKFYTKDTVMQKYNEIYKGVIKG